MGKRWKEKLAGLRLNRKFTLVIILLVIVPIAVLGGILFRNMEDNVISENVSYMQYTMERNRDNIQTNIDSVNMTTQFFLSDEALLNTLKCSARGEKMSTEALLEFYHSDIAALERLVNNNLLLYGVRVYTVNDNVQEMMPILYNYSRMKNMEWAEKEEYAGWNYGYRDTLFANGDEEGKRQLVSLITPVEDYENGRIGVIETAVTMHNMFPQLYENIEGEWSCFVSDGGNLYFGDNKQEMSEAFIREELQGREENREQGTIQTIYKRQGSEHYIVSSVYLKEIHSILFSVKDITKNVHYVYQMRNRFVAVMLAIVVGIAFLVNVIVKHLLKQFYEILGSIRQIQKGDLQVRIGNGRNDEMGELGSQIDKMLDRIQQLMKENLDRELLVKNSEIRALQNQINAHFIYNVLESIKMMAEIDEEYAISDAITSLGKLLRYSMRWVSGNVLVEEEIEYIRNYLALINLRFDYEIYLSLSIPPLILQQEIPKMSLQPIVENAIYHGIEQMAEDTNIYMKGIVDGDDCIIEITDAGKGMDQEEVKELEKKIAGEIETSGGSGNGIGLKNVQDRIHISFGENYGIKVASKIGCYTKVSVRIPLQHKGEAEESGS